MISVTGMAWTTPLGDSISAVWERLLSGQTGLRSVPHQGRLRNDLAAIVESPDHSIQPSKRLHQITCDAARRAFAEVNLPLNDSETQFIVGTSLGTYLEDSPDQSLYEWAGAV